MSNARGQSERWARHGRVRGEMRWLRVGAAGAVALTSEVVAGQATRQEALQRGWSAHGTIEAYHEWNAGGPGNGINNHRAFDKASGSLVVQNASFGVETGMDRLRARIFFQTGSLPPVQAYALGPTPPIDAESPEARHVREVNVAYEARVGEGVWVEAGLFEWPVGLEDAWVHRSWCWSRSNLYLAMPSRFAGARVTYPSHGDWAAMAGVFNGWTGLEENNGEKTLSAGVKRSWGEEVAAGLRYVGGVERDVGAREGRAWRHLLDGQVEGELASGLRLGFEGNGGMEPGRMGTTWWMGAELMLRVEVSSVVHVTGRLDGIRQVARKRSGEVASPVLFIGPGGGSGTLTIEARMPSGVSWVLEGRRDQGASPQFFRGEVLGSGAKDNPYEPNSMGQTTVLVGTTAWF